MTAAFKADSGMGATSGHASPAWPAHDVGDIALLIVEAAEGGVTLSDPQGFTELSASPVVNPGGGTTTATALSVFWCRATSSAMGDPTITDPGDHINARIVTFSGCVSSGDPVDVIDAVISPATSTSGFFPPVTTTEDDCLIVSIISIATDLTSSARFSGWTEASLDSVTEIFDNAQSLNNGGGMGGMVGLKSSAGTTNGAFVTIATSSYYNTMTVALKSEPESTTPTDRLNADLNRGFN